MPSNLPRFRAAACHTSSVFLDAPKSAEKACDLIAEAARNGASLIAFPESFIPGFPVWAALQAPIMSHGFFRAFSAQALWLDSPELTKIRMAARCHGVVVSVGFSEGTVASLGCIWNSNILIGEDGSILNHHRKLVPTYYEKLVWAAGDARGLRVVETPVGRVGMLICGENTNPLARYALMAQGEQVHISSYPPIWPTRPSKEKGGYNLRKAIEIRAGAHSFEAKCFNIVSSACVDVGMRDALGQANPAMLDMIEGTPHAVSMILDPAGQIVSPVLSETEGIAYAEIDVALCVEPKQFHDVAGYYNRFDVFSLTVDRSRRDPAIFIDAGSNEAANAMAQPTPRETAESVAAELVRFAGHGAVDLEANK
jgi:aliphatic nitrilase